MAKPVILTRGNKQYSFDVTRIDRAKLYGLRKRQPLDAAGQLPLHTQGFSLKH